MTAVYKMSKSNVSKAKSIKYEIYFIYKAFRGAFPNKLISSQLNYFW
jgi:hypothetical protein